MKRFSTKRFISLFTAVLLILTQIACNNTGKKGTETPNTQSQQKVENTDPFGKYETPIDVSFVGELTDALQKNVMKADYTFEKNPWTDAYEKELGVKVGYKWIAKSGDEYKQKLNLSLASGDIPDIMYGDVTQLSKLVASDLASDMTGMFDKYASPTSKEWMNSSSSTPFLPVTFNKKQMGIPRAWSSRDPANSFIWIRTDWLKKLSLNPPKTMDDLLKISSAFTHNDPDGNGKNDTYGLAVQKDYSAAIMSLEGFFYGYHAYPKIWQEKDGKLINGSIQPEAKNALKKLSEMFKDGQLDKEFPIKTTDKVSEDIASGKIGMMFGNQSSPMTPLTAAKKAIPSADWQPYLLVSADDKPVNIKATIGNTGYYSVRKGYKNPEVLIKMLNLYSKLYSDQYDTYGINNDGRAIWQLSPVSASYADKNVMTHLAIKESLQTGKTDKLNPEQLQMFKNVDAFMKTGDVNMWSYFRIFGPGGVTETSQAGIKYYKENNSYIIDKFVTAPTKTMSNAQTSLDTLQSEAYMKIILGTESIDYFDKFVQDWKKLGGDDITKEVNEWYSSTK